MALNREKSIVNSRKRTLITFSNPNCIISEQFRMIHTNIQLAMDHQKNGIFLITSPSCGEGKSTVAANLAISIAQQKEKVLLIDANLRSPAQHTFFKISNSNGLSDILLGRVNFEEAIIHTDIGRLDVLPSGPYPLNPVELLGSKTMQGMIRTAFQRYDFIFIDSSSVINVPDTKLLASQCDGVILVTQRRKTTREKALEAKKELEFSKANLVGVILNE